MILADALRCWGPKLEWTDYVPTIHYNQFELVECNKGLQLCAGGCKHCINITGSFVSKSCAGDEDYGLGILGMNEDGCKKVTEDQNLKYTNWIKNSIKQSKTLVANFTQSCRCSFDGCNGSPEPIFVTRPKSKTAAIIHLKPISSGNDLKTNRGSKIMSFSIVLQAMLVFCQYSGICLKSRIISKFIY